MTWRDVKGKCESCDKDRILNVRGLCTECAVVTLTVDSIKDFTVCELFYDYRYQKKLHELIIGRDLMAQRFENTLKKVAAFFFYKKQANIVPSYNALLNRWEKLWFPKDMTAYDLAVEQHEVSHGNIASYSNSAAAALERFHDDFAKDDSQPILVDETFLIPISKAVRLEGKIDLILRRGDNYRVLIMSAKQKKPNMNSLLLDFAAQRMAFEHRNETPRNVTFELYDMAGKAGFVDIEQPRVADVNALRYWATQIETTDVFAPRRGFTAYCRGCPFDSSCASFSDWPKG